MIRSNYPFPSLPQWDNIAYVDLGNGLLGANATGYSLGLPVNAQPNAINWSVQIMTNVASAANQFWWEADMGGAVGWLRMNPVGALVANSGSAIGAYNGAPPFSVRTRTQNGATPQTYVHVLAQLTTPSANDGFSGGSMQIFGDSAAPPALSTVVSDPVNFRALGARTLTAFLYCDQNATLLVETLVDGIWRKAGQINSTPTQLQPFAVTPLWQGTAVRFSVTNTAVVGATRLRLYVGYRPVSS